MPDEDLAPELPAPVARRIREQVPAEPLPDERESERKQLERHLTLDPGRCADERELQDAARSVDREGDRPERAHRVGATSTVGSSSASRMSLKKVRAWSSRSTPR